MELLEAVYIKCLHSIKDKNKYIDKILKSYSMQDDINAHIINKNNNIVIDYKTIYKNNIIYATIEYIYSNLISSTTHKRLIKDIKINLI